VRRATISDAAAIRTCLGEAFEPYRADYTAAAFADTVPDLSGIEDRTRTMICFVACDPSGEVAGTIAAQVVSATEGHLRGMAVRPQWQGSEVAARLLSEAERALGKSGCDVVSLDTTRPLARAIRFYERHGFVATGRAQDFFGMPLFEYKKTITPGPLGANRRVLILIFDRVEVLDFAGPYEVFSLATDDSGKNLCSVETIGNTPEITCVGGLRVKVDLRIADSPTADLLIVPGGPGARIPGEWDDEILSFLSSSRKSIPLIASVCTGSFLLARAGLLAGLDATTHPDRIGEFRSQFPHLNLRADKIVDEGSLITSGGISSGIDLSLYILEKWFGRSCRANVARRLDGAWK
jgi:putative intracellular protease/amidase/ribosomal protein S18 acetylase RimI-like enzyme